MTDPRAAQVLDRIRGGASFTGALVGFPRGDWDAIVEAAYAIDDEAMDLALIAEVGLDRIAEIADAEGVDLFS